MIDNRENNVWTVYVHIVPKSITEYDYDKYYVGITSRSVNERWGSNGSGYYNQSFYNAIKKYGWDNIEHYIIAEHLTEKEAKDFEITLIDKLKCNANKYRYGYNATEGGDIRIGILSEESKRKLSESHMGKNNPFYGKKHTEKSRLKMSQNHCDDNGRKKIYQFDINGKYIKTYNSGIEAARLFGLKCHHFGKYIKNQELYQNSLWGYETDVTIINNIPVLNYKYDKNKIHKISCSKNIYQFDLNGNYIATYLNIKDAIEKTNITYSVGECIKKHKQFHGYLWGFDENITIIKGVPKLNYSYKKTIPSNCHTIYMFNLDGSFIRSYDRAIEASKDNNINNEYITRSARLWNTSCGYYWRYEDGIGFDENNQPILLNKNKGGDNYD